MPVQEKIRVLIVDDIAETRENIRRLLQFDPEIEVVGAAKSGKEAIDLSAQLKPDVVIMDINMPDMDGITATEAIRRKIPYAQVVILSVQSDAHYMQRAMRVGARDFLTKPPSIDELTAAIHHAGVMAHEERIKVTQALPPGVIPGAAGVPLTFQGKVIVVYSPKGGTGCTMIATNLALALQSPETPTALIDGNMLYGDVAIFFNEQVKNSVLDLTPRVEELDADVVKEVMIDHAASGLHILAAPPKPELAVKVVSDQFAKLLQFMRQVYAFTIVDTASYLTDITQAALEVADLIVLVTTQDIPAIKNANTFLTMADATGIPRNRILFVMNRYDKRITIAPDSVSKSLRQEIVAVIPFDERAVGNSINRGQPLILENKAHMVCKSIIALAELTRNRVSKLEMEIEPISKK